MGFLDTLGSALSSAVNPSLASGLGINTPASLDLPFSPFAKLGAFSQKIDPSANRQYLETGTVRNLRPRNLEILMQQPDITVLVKKKMFSSLSENFRYDLMNSDEKLFIRAAKRLFYNKCRLIAAYERLSKIESLSPNGIIGDNILPIIFSSVDIINELSPGLIGTDTQATLDTVRQIKAFSDPNSVTTWIVDPQVPYLSDTGEGTGVFELTLVHSVDVTVSTQLGGGGASLSIEDPYKLMIISNEDIERAITDAAGFFSNNAFIKGANEILVDTLANLQGQLTKTRLNRGVSNIVFFVDAGSQLYKKIRAIIDESGIEINFTYSGGLAGIGSSTEVDASAMEGINGLNAIEVDLFKSVINAMQAVIANEQTSANQTITFNKQTNYVRRKMQMFFGGKPIVQTMDTIHIYIGSKTQKDAQISQGLSANFSTTSTLGGINSLVGNVSSALNNLSAAFGGGPTPSFAQLEKNAIVGPDFPMWLWMQMRNDITRMAAGTHVFAGVVSDSPHSYSNGKYELSISAKDNADFFNFGQVNINPSSDVFNADLYDPLTPFNLNFNLASGFVNGELPPLLDENVRLLNSGSIKANNGRFRGQSLTEQLYKAQDGEQVAAKIFKRKLNDPNGFVYRWKEGIGSMTKSGPPHGSSSASADRSPSMTKDPFSGQDVMNSLSLLITGQPYNFNNFLKGALASGALNRNELSNEGGSSSFFRGLISDLTKQNQTWGNFLPFKKMVINQAGYTFLRSGQFDLTTANSQITDLLEERAKRFDELASLIPELANNPQFYQSGGPAKLTKGLDTSSLSKLAGDIITLDAKINQTTKSFNSQVQNVNLRSTDGALTIFGNDISFDPTFTTSSPLTGEQHDAVQDQFRKSIHDLTQRRLWKVKANQDNNLFIVDDSYDKNYDIQAFEAALTGKIETFKSEYTKVFEKISMASQLLGLEVFANSQGHIEARPPQYNRMPSSVFYKMLQQKTQKGIQIFPEYLESLFLNQIQGITQQLEICEDEIRLRCAVLGATNNNDAQKLLKGSSDTGLGVTNFFFVTSDDGTFGGEDVRKLLTQATPDLDFASATSALSSLNNAISGVTAATVNFDIVARTTLVNSAAQFTSTNDQINSLITTIAQRLSLKTGQVPATKQSLIGDSRSQALSNSKAGLSQLDIFNLTQQISQFISERQGLVKILAGAIKNLNQGLAVNNDPSVGKDMLFPNLSTTANSNIPEIMAHMIEDEAYDDYGPGSGQRFILTDSKIISLTINEKAPDFTIATVVGSLSNNIVSSGFDLGDGGNGVTSAYVTDYDMWRMYGFKQSKTIPATFFENAESQCAPYGVFMLNKARKDIFQANCVVAGNEFIQAGEVYYIEDRDLLFYAESIRHSFTFGGQFTTSLSLKYGRNPGEYIPTMLDVIGKGLYTKKFQSNLIKHVRHDNGNGDVALVTLVVTPGASDITGLVGGGYGDQNRKNLANLLLTASGALTSSNQKITIEIRNYYNSKLGIGTNDSVVSVGKSVADWVVNPSKFSADGSSLLPDAGPSPIDKDSVQSVSVDLGDTVTTNSPSSQAWNLARTVSGTSGFSADTGGSSSALGSLETNALVNQILDIWITFSPQSEVNEPPATVESQADQNQIQNYIKSFNARLKD